MLPKLFDSLITLFMKMWIELTVLFLIITVLLFILLKYKYTYWERHGIRAVKASIPFGCFADLLFGKRHISEILQDVYRKGEGHKYIGYYSFWTPGLLVRDPELIKKILIKDFDYFYDRGVYYNDKEDPLSAHLFSLQGMKWKNTRTKLNPNFSNGKIKQMYETMKMYSIQLREHLTKKIEGNEEIDFKKLLSRHAINVIANAGIGIEEHSLERESKLCEISLMATASTRIQGFRFVLAMLSKDIARIFNMRFTPKEVERYYLDFTKEIVEKRSKSTVQRNDLMQQIFQMWDRNLSFDYHENSENPTSLTFRDVAAQVFVFILGAYESAASLLCFTLYELAKNPEIQEELIAEIDTLGPTEDVTYEQLLDLKYLDMVLNETLRKYPGSGVVFRECQKPYKLPNGKILETGITIAVPTYSLHFDHKYFPNPEKYDPERFNRNNPTHPIVPFTYLPFGDGPRNCIGKRYGVVNAKIALIIFLSKFKYELTDKSPDPMKFDPKIFNLQSIGGMYLKAIIRK